MARFLEPQSHDYRPEAARLAVVVPDYADPDGQRDQAIVATAKAISHLEGQLARFTEALKDNPKAPAPDLEVDTSLDADEVYSNLTAPERAERDREFVAVTTHRRTTDSMLFEEQLLAKAKAFVGLTN